MITCTCMQSFASQLTCTVSMARLVPYVYRAARCAQGEQSGSLLKLFMVPQYQRSWGWEEEWISEIHLFSYESHVKLWPVNVLIYAPNNLFFNQFTSCAMSFFNRFFFFFFYKCYSNSTIKAAIVTTWTPLLINTRQGNKHLPVCQTRSTCSALFI